MRYAIAAYVVVLGSLLAYAVRLHLRRRALLRRGRSGASASDPHG